MGLLGAGDFVYAIRFLRLLTMPYKKTAAFKAGVIDDKGKLIKSPETSQEKKSYNAFHRLVFNIRRLLQKVPVIGKSRLTNYVAALFLLKEHTGMTEKKILKVLSEATGENVNAFLMLSEDVENTWHLIEDTNTIRAGIYSLVNDLDIYNVKTSSMVRINEHESIGSMFGIKLYEAFHIKSNQKILVTQTDIKSITV